MNKNVKNKFKLEIDSKKENEIFLLDTISAFISSINPQPEDVADLRTAVEEAFTNARIHAYPDCIGRVVVTGEILHEHETTASVVITVKDYGVGIDDVEQAKTPLFSTGDDMAGLGFTCMGCFAQLVSVRSTKWKGTTITLRKVLSKKVLKEIS